MASLIFLNPLMLAGLAAVSIPLIVHAFFRQRRRRVRFASLRFLLAGDRRSAQRHRLVDLLVLAMRIAMLALLALALAQPVLRPAGAKDVAFGKLSVAVVIDDTLSMRRTAGGASLFERAIESAKTLLAALPDDAEARIVLASGRKPPALAAPASPPNMLAGALDALDCSYASRTLGPALGAATDALAASKPGHHALIVIGDMHARSFGLGAAGSQEAKDDKDEKEKSEIPTLITDAARFSKAVSSVQVIDLGGAEENLSIGEAIAEPAVCFPGEALRVRARAYNSGAEAARASVSLWSGETQLQRAELETPARGQAEAVFSLELNEPGWTELALRVEDAALKADNAAFVAARVLPPLNALIIAPAGDATGGAREEALYLKTALDPSPGPSASAASESDGPLRVDVADESNYLAQSFSRYGHIFWIDGGDAPPQLAAQLLEYARGGGQVTIFPGLAWLKREDGELGPLRVAGVAKKSGAETGFGKIDAEHPIFALLKSSAAEVFERATFGAHLNLDETAFGPRERVAARLADGAPLLVESAAGAGALLIWSAGPRPEYGDWVLRPVFLPLMYETLKRGAGSSASRIAKAVAGEGFTINAAPSQAPRAVKIEGPFGGAEEYDAAAIDAVLEAGDAELTIPQAAAPGFYRTAWPGEEAFPVAVNADPAESDLRRAAPKDVAALFPENLKPNFSSDAQAAAARLAFATQGRHFSGLLLGLALAALLIETFLANLFLRPEKNETAAPAFMPDRSAAEKM